MRYAVRIAAVFLATLVVSIAAQADTLTYDFVTSNTPYGIISTSLPASPIPSSFTANSFEITAPLIVDGDPMTMPVDFYTAAAGGGAGGAGVHVTGPVLFTGPTSSPMFLTGTYDFEGFTLTVTQELSSVPEPTSLLLFGTGVLAFYWLGRRGLGIGK